ncbi:MULTISPECIES: Cof-type HAD-IIB family hydrolase [Paenibacillus]|uniref:Cof-like hydrolase n=2 Tax=Paenibacillus lactis TaxID=228574 RepID=G4HDC0_9BACL|nr:Cof-type HAD-IIB family hydrolase [Paenibacillus lactis]EHB66046.1 Cof-like hydrolase [Paenibacillus lactis 154]MBP1891433.1 HAD superfamily hydrolase (TIGR01484 family) [Paenibacillus lactis]MCM3493858.1 Cof-type HAD-IIB family hydrolase [Paenibacillus lactis]HAF98198.1 HAD family phosphatase [Paenibacillus lactis]
MNMVQQVKAKYKLIALDLDGTLLTDEKQITQETKRWLQYAIDHGVKVMFSTGRGLQTAQGLWDELGLDSPMVLLNGAEIWEGPGRLKKRVFLPRDTVRNIHAIASERGEWYWGYSVESLTGDKEWTPEMFERDWMKFGIGSHEQQKLAEIKEELLRWGTLEVTRSAPTNMEISVKGTTKESGVQEVCQMLGLSMSDVIAMGDSDNDAKLLKAAGLGVAMANGEDYIKSIADVMTATNNEDGVAQAIRKYVFQME